jgi:hypothetical protein
MPYVVTTKRPYVRRPYSEADEFLKPLFRRAVATPEEARDRAKAIVIAAMPMATADWRSLRAAALTLPESGGTVGPLPDGTVIEVETSSWVHLALGARRDRSLRPLPVVEASQGDAEAAATIIAAFNARGVMARDVDRWAFLAGEGSLTVSEVVEWAKELGHEPTIPPGVDRGDSLIVSFRGFWQDRWRADR